MSEERPDDPVAVLERWERAGGTWRVVHRSGEGVTLALLTCVGGEEVSRIAGDGPGLLQLLDTRAAQDEPPS